MKRLTAEQALAAGAAAVTIALTAAAFWLSYEHLHDIASANGLTSARAWAWPGTVDAFIIAGELLILRASLKGAIDGWAIALAASGSLGSIALNVFGVGVGADAMEYVVAAVPPTAALVAFGALMRQVHDALHRIQAAAPAPEPASVTFERAAEQAVAVAALPVPPQPFILDLAPMQPPHPEVCATTPDAGQGSDAVAVLADPDADAELLAAALKVNAAALAKTGRPASLRRLQDELRIGQRRAQRIQPKLPRSA
ncbi:DUF2637 domain-containing protein [Streptomyces sp. A1136]|uniref:DUF2637 domain-containing protein n=1 Tax=Streptomyces sp. A1136 TaxID=2563102 RepID=UPI00109E9CD2|nr:DUF2637 domain-containing protein [Streptomyces sp. A1136]THA56118.1 DUF2637 domain-containing protein [Streptomyces sp. A1136]